MQHVFVTGAAGFIGSNLVDRLLADGVTITGGNSLGIDLKAFAGLKFNASAYNGKALKAEAVQ